MLEKLEGEGRLVGLDIDPIESEKTVKRNGVRLSN